MDESGQQMGKGSQTGTWIKFIGIIPSAWLIVSPWVLGFAAANPALTGNDVVGGIVLLTLVLLNLASLSLMRRLGMIGIMLLSGIWLCIAAALYGHGSGAAFWSTLVSGIVIVLLGALQLVRSVLG
jgi:hypothetical protein